MDNHININSHINMLLEKYKLNTLYNMFIISSILEILSRQCFYWSLILLSSYVKKNPDKIKQYAFIILSLYIINIPIKWYNNKIKNKLIMDLKIANNNFFNDKIINISKTEILNFDLVKYFDVLLHFNENIHEYIDNLKVKYTFPVKAFTIFIVGSQQKFNIVLILCIILAVFVVNLLNMDKLQEEKKLTKKYFIHEDTIRNYTINSKNFIINSDFNKRFLSENINDYEDTIKNMAENDNTLDFKNNIIIFILIIIMLYTKLSDLTILNFYIYFILIYDIEKILETLTIYYKNKVYEIKMLERLHHLYSFNTNTVTQNNLIINTIIINKAKNNIPKIDISHKITITKGNPVLIDGESGSGKTTLLYTLKGIIKLDELNIQPKIEDINNTAYITLPSHKSLFSDNLYNIITNYEKNPNIDLINQSLKLAKIEYRLNKNEFVNIEELSAGEKIRLLITRIIYTIKSKNYQILLFDEIDENLNSDLAYEIATNIINIFNDKIIIYITHNKNVKSIFKHVLTVNNGIIN